MNVVCEYKWSSAQDSGTKTAFIVRRVCSRKRKTSSEFVSGKMKHERKEKHDNGGPIIIISITIVAATKSSFIVDRFSISQTFHVGLVRVANTLCALNNGLIEKLLSSFLWLIICPYQIQQRFDTARIRIELTTLNTCAHFQPLYTYSAHNTRINRQYQRASSIINCFNIIIIHEWNTLFGRFFSLRWVQWSDRKHWLHRCRCVRPIKYSRRFATSISYTIYRYSLVKYTN